VPETFLLVSQIGSDLSLSVARIVHDFGDGYEKATVTGNSAGEEYVTLVFNTLTDRDSDTVTDPEDMVVKTKTKYLIDFFLRRMNDGEAFNVTTTRGATLLVTFAESEINLKTISRKAFSTGLRFRQHRT
jgi:hypothetical protein